MTGKQFLSAIANGTVDVVELLLGLLNETGAGYAVVGGVAVNAYAEPVVSLDLGLVVVAEQVEALVAAARARGLKVERFEHSVNLTATGSDLRVQLQTDPRYQAFVGRAETREVLGYSMRVARAEDVICGKAWAYADESRRRSKRQKDLADILRLVEADPSLLDCLPPELRRQVS